MDTAHIALSGIQAGFARLGASAHDVANLVTEDFHPLRTRQVSLQGGGTRAFVERSPTPEEVDLAAEWVEQIRASHQILASLRVLETDASMRGVLLDMMA